MRAVAIAVIANGGFLGVQAPAIDSSQEIAAPWFSSRAASTR